MVRPHDAEQNPRRPRIHVDPAINCCLLNALRYGTVAHRLSGAEAYGRHHAATIRRNASVSPNSG
jgi:hypothetical protein